MLHLIMVAIGFSILTVTVMATFWLLPKGVLNHFAIRATTNFTKALQPGAKTWQKVLYWGIPAFILLFSNWLAGLALLAASIIGLTYIKKLAEATKQYSGPVSPPSFNNGAGDSATGN